VMCTASVAAHAHLGPLCESVQACRRAGVLRVDDDLAALYEIAGATVAPPRILGQAATAAEDALCHAVRRGWDVLLVDGRGPVADELLAPARRPGLPVPVDARAALDEAGVAWPAAARATVASVRRRRAVERLDALVRQARMRDGAVSGRVATAQALAAGVVDELVITVPAPAPPSTRAAGTWPPAAEALLHAAARAGAAITVVPATPDVRRPVVAAQLRSGARGRPRQVA
jgi:hypothetical protein